MHDSRPDPKISLGISILIHLCVFVLLWKTSFLIQYSKHTQRLINVDLLAIERKKFNSNVPSNKLEMHKDLPANLNDINNICIDLDSSRNNRSVYKDTYFDKVRKKIVEHMWYPDEAVWRKEKGNVKVRFSLDTQGVLQSSKIINSSGSDILDKAALSAVVSAQPYPRIPLSLKKENIEFSISLYYDENRKK